MKYILPVVTVIASLISLASLVNAIVGTTYTINATIGDPAPFVGAPENAIVGDTLVFNLNNHAVVDIPQSDYDGCNVTLSMKPTIGLTSNGPQTKFNFVLHQAGTYYIVCPIGDGAHCNEGMKFVLTVVGDSLTKTTSLLMATTSMETTATPLTVTTSIQPTTSFGQKPKSMTAEMGLFVYVCFWLLDF